MALRRIPPALVIAVFLLGNCGGSQPTTGRDDTASTTGTPVPASEPTPQTDEITYDGIDVSHFQGQIDWTQVQAAGIFFAFAKATEGTSEVDSEFATYWPAMRAAGLVRGAYHFFESDQDPIAQAEHFLATVPYEVGDLAPMLDVETIADSMSSQQLDAAVRTWLKRVAEATGVQPLLYSDETFLENYLATGFGDYPLWIAAYQETPPTVPPAWNRWTIWQYTDTGTVTGIGGDVDRDRYQGTATAFQALRIPATP